MILAFIGCDSTLSVTNTPVSAVTIEAIGQGEPIHEYPRSVVCDWIHPIAGENQWNVWVFNGDTIGMAPFDGAAPSFATLTFCDAPEIDQPFGEEAADRLTQLLSTEKVSAGPATKSELNNVAELKAKGIIGSQTPVTSYGRPSWSLTLRRNTPILIAVVMAEEGLCWWTGPEHSPGSLAMLRAIKAKRGIWSRPMPIAPWVWRELTEEQRRRL